MQVLVDCVLNLSTFFMTLSMECSIKDDVTQVSPNLSYFLTNCFSGIKKFQFVSSSYVIL